MSPRCNHNNNHEYHSNKATINGEKNGAPFVKDLEATHELVALILKSTRPHKNLFVHNIYLIYI